MTFYNRTVDKILIVVVPTALFIYASTRPHLRLRADMPPEFVDSAAGTTPARRTDEERLAKEYWKCALTTLQWKHTYGSPLPLDPPDDFRIVDKSSNGTDLAAASRTRYWKRLQKLWLLPESWKSSREWSFTWLTEPIARMLDWFDSYFKDLIKSP